MQTKNLLRKIYGVTQRKVCERKGNRKKGGGGGRRKIERKRDRAGGMKDRMKRNRRKEGQSAWRTDLWEPSIYGCLSLC